jgi:2-polyprenyl-6-hydroxyphenyl methylase/3-demethylubiquinone-9 3-methyltransferase
MYTVFMPICPEQVPCKCCGTQSPLYGVVDFHKNCVSRQRQTQNLSGIPIYYYRCPDCHFLFTCAFDHFSTADFLHHIYNDEYALVDPDFREIRPRAKARLVMQQFAHERPRSILDYGGGNGLFAETLNTAAFAPTETYDPFVPRYSARPTRQFDCITSFEVVEHSTEPVRVFAEMRGLLADPGIIVFSTLLQPPAIEQQGLDWWYAGPRNGHVSLFSRESLERIGTTLGLQFVSWNADLHVFFKGIPPFAAHLLKTVR